MNALVKVLRFIANPPPQSANNVLMLVVLFWGVPSLTMLLVPAFMWSSGTQLSVGWFASAVVGLFLLLAYTRFVVAFIGLCNGEDWLRDQWEQFLRKYD